MAKFSRGSTAYKSDGSVVASGVPRFERIGKNLWDAKKIKAIEEAYNVSYKDLIFLPR